MKRSLTRFLAFVTLILLVSSCQLIEAYFPAAPPPEKIQKTVIEYDYTPPSGSIEKSDISLILLEPMYANGFNTYSQPMYTNFIDNMSADFEEMLVAKGYSLRGPYQEYDQIVYSDKVETDLLLEVQIDFSHDYDDDAFDTGRPRRVAAGEYKYKYEVNGNLHLGGKINLILKESLTREKLWIKSITLNSEKVYIHTDTYTVGSREEGIRAIRNDPQYINTIYNVMNKYYINSLDMAWKHLDPKELQSLSNQVRELRAKKGF